MRWVLPTLALLGCGSPITNIPFYTDAEFLAALPNELVYGPPVLLLDLEGEAPLQVHARTAVAEMDVVVAPMVLAGEALRASQPVIRETLAREWEATPVVSAAGRTLDLFWVRAEMVRSDLESEISWTMQIASDASGPWVDAASGTHQPDGTGEASWDHQATAEVTGLDVPYLLEVDYAWSSDQAGGERLTEVALRSDVGAVRYWTAAGQIAMGWTGLFTLTDDEETWPGSARAVHTEDGGFASAVLQRMDEELVIDACWTADGELVWQDGDDVPPLGSASACPISDPFAE